MKLGTDEGSRFASPGRANNGGIPGPRANGGPLGEGDLEGRIVLCPWHAWRWDVTTGANANNPAVKMACFPVSVENGAVFVELP